MRTRTFANPLPAQGQDGIFLELHLASDDEPERRMWKVVLRNNTSRREMVFQSKLDLAKAQAMMMMEEEEDKEKDWASVQISFDDFRLVRGPRLVVDGEKLDVSGGIFQIDMTLRKFKIAVNTTELEGFRERFFDLHVRKIGFYRNKEAADGSGASATVSAISESDPYSAAGADADADTEKEIAKVQSQVQIPDTLSKKEAASKRPLPLEILFPLDKILFSENSNRRKIAMNILRKRNMSISKAILFGIKSRTKSIVWAASIYKTTGILGVDSVRSAVKNLLKVVFLYPLRLVGGLVKMVKKALGMKVKPSLRE